MQIADIRTIPHQRKIPKYLFSVTLYIMYEIIISLLFYTPKMHGGNIIKSKKMHSTHLFSTSAAGKGEKGKPRNIRISNIVHKKSRNWR